MITPLSPPENHIIELTSDSKIDRNGNLEGSIKITGNGYSDQRLRRVMAHGARAMDRRMKVEQWISEIAPQAELISFDIDYNDIRDVNKPIMFDIKYKIQGYALIAVQNMHIVPPLANHIIKTGRIAPYLKAASLKERTQPLSMGCTRYWKVREKIHLPDDVTLLRVPVNIDIDNEVASINVKYENLKNAITFDEDLIVKLKTIPVQGYAGFKEVIDKVKQISGNRVVVRL
jgi:hypothetical protein